MVKILAEFEPVDDVPDKASRVPESRQRIDWSASLWSIAGLGWCRLLTEFASFNSRNVASRTRANVPGLVIEIAERSGKIYFKVERA